MSLFFKIGELFQELAVSRSKRSIKSLLEICPDSANLKTPSGVKTVSPETVEIGQTILVKPGEKILLDGEILDGSSLVDTAALTGESVPRSVEEEGAIMTSSLLNVLTYTLIPVTAATVGGAIAAWRTPGPRVRSCVQHFAAGVVVAAAAGELLPDVVHEKSLWAVVIGGAIGVAVMLAVKQLAEKASGSMSLIATVGVDVLIDGLIIGIGFAAGAKEGILLTIALTIELLFLSLSVSATLSQDNASRGRVITTTLGIALLLPLGAAVGVALLGGLSGPTLAAFFAFGLVALLYLVTEELLVEAHEIPDTPLTTAIFFVGFLLLIVIEEMLR